MANSNAPELPTPDPAPRVPLAMTMAYASGQPAPNSHITSQLYRLRRGFPFQRAGIAVAPIPQFKALSIYSHTPSTRAAPNPRNNRTVPAPFQNTAVPKVNTISVEPVYTWPIGSRNTP